MYALLPKPLVNTTRSYAKKELPAYTEHDLNYRYNLTTNSEITAEAKYFFTIPPLDDSNPNNQLNAALYNPRGKMSFRFKQRF